MMTAWFTTAHAENLETTTSTEHTTAAAEHAEGGGLSLDPGVIAFQALNFVILPAFFVSPDLFPPVAFIRLSDGYVGEQTDSLM